MTYYIVRRLMDLGFNEILGHIQDMIMILKSYLTNLMKYLSLHLIGRNAEHRSSSCRNLIIFIGVITQNETRADHGEEIYSWSGRLKNKKAIVTVLILFLPVVCKHFFKKSLQSVAIFHTILYFSIYNCHNNNSHLWIY